MRSQRIGWLGSTILAAIVVLVPAAATVRAQPGYGADPFWPYNQQYTPYTGAGGLPNAEGGGQLPNGGRDGLRGANRFDDYINDMEGPGRNVSDRSNIGMPYYRSAVDPDYETGRGARQYLPNSRTRETFEESQRRAADLYFRYYAERDPIRRSELLREYREARREGTLALSGRGGTTTRTRGAASSREGRAGQGTRAGGLDRARSRPGGMSPAPEVPPIGSLRGSAPRARRGLPSDVLNRSEAMDDDRDDRVLPSPGSPGISGRSRGRGTSRTAPPIGSAGAPSYSPAPPPPGSDRP